MLKTLEEYMLDAAKQTDPKRNQALSSIDETTATQLNNTNATYNLQVDQAKQDYNDLYEKNAVQKEINQHLIAEKNAALGLTDSGLNRTQMTAAQLSHSKQKGDLDIARQNTLDTLNVQLTNAIAEINNAAAANKLSVNQYYDDLNASIANSLYKTDVENAYKQWEKDQELAYKQWEAQLDASTALQMAEIEARGKTGNDSDSGNDTLLWYFTGTYDDDENPIFRNSEGKTQAFGTGVNPYTGTKNADAKNGTFSNGYQPNNIDGKTLRAQEEYEVYVNGKKQKVWSYDDGETLWAWDGSINEYVDVTSRRDELEKKNG